MYIDANDMHLIPRAFIRQPSGRHLNLVSPDPQGWTDEDLAIGLSRTYRWGGHSIWPLPLSVAQHSLAVLALRQKHSASELTLAEAQRELLHDADEALIGGFDAISPLKPLLGRKYAKVVINLQMAVFKRYDLKYWTDKEYRIHKHADNLAGASEAVHVAGWSTEEVLDLLNIGLKPLTVDPLAELYDVRPWEPWAPNIAAERFLKKLQEQSAEQKQFVPTKTMCEGT
ncbi:MAG: phosphohydrolase [Pseudomonadota bacterium]